MTEDEIRRRFADAADALAPERAVDPGPIAASARRALRRRVVTRLGVATALAAVVGAVGLTQLGGSDDEVPVETVDEGTDPGWERLPDPPLSPRTGATAAWTGEEVLVVGGWEHLCPPGADCSMPDTSPFADGAAYDPAAGSWRPIAPSPFAFHGEQAAVVAGDLYVLVGCDDCFAAIDEVAFVHYDPDADEWTTLPAPPDQIDRDIGAVGRFVVAYAGSDEAGEHPDLLFDTETSTWSELPDDPFAGTYDRTLSPIDGGDGLLLIAARIGGPTEPSANVNVVARYDIGSGQWTELPPPPGRGYRGWGVDDLVVLEPHFGGHGGSFDPATGTWTELPPNAAPEGWENQVAGVLGADDAVYAASSGWVLDLRVDAWIEVEPVDGRDTYPDTSATAVGRDLFLYGGASFETSAGRLLGDAWIWRAPGASGDGGPTVPTNPDSQVVIELTDIPMYVEGFDLAVRITDAEGTVLERRLTDFVELAPPPNGSSALTVVLPAGSAVVQAHLTIGQGPGPRVPDFVDRGDGSLCTPVEVAAPPGGEATVRMDWRTGCLESDDAVAPEPSGLLPDRPPDAVGVIAGPQPGDVDQRLRLTVSSGQQPYYDQAYLTLDGAVIVSGVTGEQVPASSVVVGTRVEVWAPGCDESAPVQCSAEAIRIRR